MIQEKLINLGINKSENEIDGVKIKFNKNVIIYTVVIRLNADLKIS